MQDHEAVYKGQGAPEEPRNALMDDRASGDSRKLLLAAVLLHFIAFTALLFVDQIFKIRGKLYIVLEDDAMISMRYAWHIAHGYGPYWNTAKGPEGYTNFLLVLCMSAFHWLGGLLGISDNLVSFPVILMNLAFDTAALWLFYRVALRLTAKRRAAAFGLFAFALSSQYLLWSKAGFETSILVLCTVGAIWLLLEERLLAAGLILALGVLSRDEYVLVVAVLAVAQVIAYPQTRGRFRRVVSLCAAPVIAVAAHELFRWHYYRDLLPNTYYLKASRLPLAFRISSGFRYGRGMVPVLLFSFIALLLALRVRSSDKGKRAALLSAVLLIPVYSLYVWWVGGDAFQGSRLFSVLWVIAPLALSFFFADLESEKWRTLRAPFLKWSLAVLAFALVIVSPPNSETRAINRSVLMMLRLRLNQGWLPNYTVVDGQTPANAVNVWDSLVVADDADARKLTNRSMAVYWAGNPPYFREDFVAIDLLGKSDAKIARQKPHIPGRVGHNKYDYDYSLGELKPAYLLSSLSNLQLMNEPAYVNAAPGEWNFQYLLLSRQFNLHYRDNPIPNTFPVIFRRDDAQ